MSMKFSVRVILALILLSTSVSYCFSQTATEYLSNMTAEFGTIKNGYFAYINQIAHGKSAKKADAKRQEVIGILKESRSKIAKMKGFNGKTALRDSMISYLDLSYNVMTHDYAKIMDMEAISEQSYDFMEAYVKAQEIANDKMNKGSESLSASIETFAKENNITLNAASEDNRDRILKIANSVMKFQSNMTLLLFKSSFHEQQMIAALSAGNISMAQQSRKALIETSKTGLSSLDTIPSYKGDDTMEEALRNLLSFYQDEANNQMPTLLGFYQAKENFEKIKKVIDSKPRANVTKEEADQYNNALQKYNNSITSYNAKNTELNATRSKLIDNWNNTNNAFLDKQIPKK